MVEINADVYRDSEKGNIGLQIIVCRLLISLVIANAPLEKPPS